MTVTNDDFKIFVLKPPKPEIVIQEPSPKKQLKKQKSEKEMQKEKEKEQKEKEIQEELKEKEFQETIKRNNDMFNSSYNNNLEGIDKLKKRKSKKLIEKPNIDNKISKISKEDVSRKIKLMVGGTKFDVDRNVLNLPDVKFSKWFSMIDEQNK